MSDMVFPLKAYFIDRAPRIVENALMKRLYTIYFDLASTSTGYESSELKGSIRTGHLRRHIKHLKILLNSTLNEGCETGLYRPRV